MCFKSYVRNGKQVNPEHNTTSPPQKQAEHYQTCMSKYVWLLRIEKMNVYNGGIVHSVFDTLVYIHLRGGGRGGGAGARG